MDEMAFHKPVLVNEVIELLGFKKFAHSKVEGKFIDATLGLGGYEFFLKDFNLSILGIDVDAESLSLAKKKLAKAGLSKNIIFERANFRNISEVAKMYGFVDVDMVLFDLGVSSYQIENFEYGLSFKYTNAPLDMRIDRQTNLVSAKDILNFFDAARLQDIFKLTLSKKIARVLALEIIKKRRERKFEKIGDLLEIVNKVVKKNNNKLHPATKVFLALRMVVNSELENLREALPLSFELLKEGGRLGVISFHSGEDRIVKNFFIGLKKDNKGIILNKKPIVPSTNEVLENPRSRSAKLRVIEKI